MVRDREAQMAEIEANYEEFKKLLPELIQKYRGKYAVMRKREIVEIMDTAGDALKYGNYRFEGRPFSIQEITDEVVDLGWFSHVEGAWDWDS